MRYETDANGVISVVQFRPVLGQSVRITDADITGIVCEHTQFLDESQRWGVRYWHEGVRHTVNCEACELEPIE